MGAKAGESREPSGRGKGACVADFQKLVMFAFKNDIFQCVATRAIGDGERRRWESSHRVDRALLQNTMRNAGCSRAPVTHPRNRKQQISMKT